MSAQPGSTRLLVVRHGQSEWNAQRRWQGQADPPLSEHGLNQAAQAGLQLGTFDAVWSSDLQRALYTAAIIAEINGIGPVQIDIRLRETDVGPWEGLTHDEVEQGWPGFLASHQRPEGFEDYDSAAQRMISAFVDIATASPGGEVLVVSHGGVISAVRRLIGAGDERIPNLAGSWFFLDGTALSAGELVTLIETEPAGSAL
jgi:probable phosphoglycerate mutase